MKQIIRNNTFETNSSSMHSLVVVKDPKPYKNYETLEDWADRDSFDLFWYFDGTYERTPFRVLRTPVEKLRYYVAHYIGTLGRKSEIPKVINFIHEHTGIPKRKINIKTYDDYDNKYVNYGYAGSNDTGEDVFTYIEANNIPMEEFVLNPKYVVIVDGDEYQEFKKLFQSNVIDAENFEYISSGADFWNDSIYSISLFWLVGDSADYDLLSSIDNVTKFVKHIRLNVYEDCIDAYDDHVEELKMFITEVKKRFPNITAGVSIEKKLAKKMRAKDISMFDYLEYTKYEYSDNIVERIKIV